MLEILIFGLVVFAVICLWVLIEQRKSPKFLIWFIPLFLVLVTSTYLTYTSILGFPKLGVPKQGLYLKHYIDEPDWIYIWVLGNNNIPMGYKLIYTRGIHNSLLGVQGKSEQGKFMMLGEEEEEVEGELTGEVGQDSSGGFTVGGDISFYEWDFEARMPPKNITTETETNR
tara:strand:+ start:505 stop:1017 length:513 start_codon:yes stop_codon:yes gene_type:complete